MRHGRAAEASPLLAAAAADPLLAPVAGGLSRAARRAGRLVLSALAEAGWDSNVDLTPGSSLAPSGAGDGFGRATGAATLSPWGERGPYARAVLAWRGQAGQRDLDLLGGGGAAGIQLGQAQRSLLLEYAWDGRRLAGAPYLSAHRLLVEGRVALGQAATAGGSYALRSEAYRGDAGDFSGTVQTASSTSPPCWAAGSG